MRRRFTKTEKVNGELAVRKLSKKAEDFYEETDPLEVYEVEVEDENGEDEKRYFVTGCFQLENATLEELDETFSSWYDEMHEEE